MTLVVAKLDKESRGIQIYSDTKITDVVKKENSKLFEGVIKTVIYRPEICVSYAGLNSYAEEINKILFGYRTKLNIKEFIQMLRQFHQHRNKEIDFLISSIQYNKLGFFKISNGAVEGSYTSSWIGDINAFNLFQTYFHSLTKEKKGRKIFEYFEEAFNNVILNSDLDSIGGIPILVERTENGFEYCMRTKSILGRPYTMTLTKGKSIPIDFGSAKEGSYNTVYLRSGKSSKPALGIHYFDGNFGIFSYPELSRHFQFYKEVSVSEFIKKVKEEHDIELVGFPMNRNKVGDLI